MATPVLRAQGLQKRFGTVHAVRGLDLEVRRGEILGFLGPNGAGKTTSIRMMAGLLRPTSGRVRIGASDEPVSTTSVRRQIGLCPQENVVYPELKVRENVEYAAALYGIPKAKRRRRASALLHALGLEGKEKALADDLSGGLKRRLTLAMALAHGPRIVFLDEPEAGLDPQSRVAVRAFIRRIARTCTVVLTSHNMDEVERLADRVIIMDHGRVIAEGTPEGLKAEHGTGERIAFTLQQPDAGPVARRMKLAGVSGTHAEGSELSVVGRGLVPRIPELAAAVRRAGGEVADMRYTGNTLEEVFIALTGRRLRE